MYPYADINPDLAQGAFGTLQFDLYRLVDPLDHRVYACPSCPHGEDMALHQAPGRCYSIWKRAVPCRNCTSRSCLSAGTAMFKIEYLDGRVLLITSVPVQVAGRDLALELVKDMTESLMVADPERHDNIEITDMINRFNELAVRDAFTHLYNKTFISNELQGLIHAAAHDGRDVAAPVIAELDIDDFKLVNDTYGHGVGDDVLLHFAQQLKAVARSFGGWVGRLGGDEFLFCVPRGLSASDLERFFDAVEGVSRRMFDTDKGSFSVTASCGVCFLREGDTVRTWLDRADGAMYEAKGLPDRRVAVR